MSRLVEIVAPARLGPGFRWLLASSWIANLGDGIALAAGPLLVASQTDHVPGRARGAAPVGAAAALRPVRRRAVRPARPTLDRDHRSTCSAPRAGPARHRDRWSTSRSIGWRWSRCACSPPPRCSRTTPPRRCRRCSCTATTWPSPTPACRPASSPSTSSPGPPIGAALFAAGMAWPFVARRSWCCWACWSPGSRCPRTAATPRRCRGPARHRRGLRWVWHHAAVRTLALTIFIFNITFGAAWSVLVLYARAPRPRRRRLRADHHGLGASAACSAPLSYGWITRRVSLGNLMRHRADHRDASPTSGSP